MKHLLSFICATVLFYAQACPIMAQDGQVVEIKKSFVNVYEELDPKSKVLLTANAGVSWLQVKVSDKTGWVERQAGEIVDGGFHFPVVPVLILLLLAAITFVIVYLYIKKQKEEEL
jgi:hypothetical protein